MCKHFNLFFRKIFIMKQITTKFLSLLVFFSGFIIHAQEFKTKSKHQLEAKNKIPFKVILQENIQNTSNFVPFNVPPPASDPMPVDGATNVPVFQAETATGLANAVQLGWEGSDEATDYEINLGVTPTGLNYLGDFQGTLLTLTGVTEETTYYWQIIPKNSSGSAANNPVWSFTTANMNASSAPLAAINPTPEDEAINVELTPTVNAAGNPTQELNFSWEVPTNSEIVAQYIFKLGFDDEVDDFETTAFQTNITITGIPYGTEIFWEVIPQNSQGTPNNTEVWSFTTEELANEGAPLAAFNPIPPDGSFNVMLNEELDENDEIVFELEFSWSLPEDSEPVAEYEFNLGFDNNVDAFTTTLTGTSINLSGLQKGITYFWQVIPSNSSGPAVNNEIWSFTTEEVPTDEIPLAAINPTPSDGEQDVFIIFEESPEGETSTSVLFEWEIPEDSEFVAFIDFELSENPDLSDAFETVLLGDTSSLNLSGMDYETTYYWRLTPTNSTGVAENTEIWTFTTEQSMSSESFTKNDFVHFVQNNWLQIQSQLDIDQISLYSIGGSLIYHADKLNTSEVKVDISTYSNGVYIAQLSINGTPHNFKFVK